MCRPFDYAQDRFADMPIARAVLHFNKLVYISN